MKENVNRTDFIDRFKKMRPENFSYKGLNAFFDYFEALEEDTGEEIDFDCIAICCDYTEYESLQEFQEEYSADYDSIEDIERETTVIRIPGSDGFIVQNF